MSARIYVKPITRIWLRPRCAGDLPAVMAGFKRKITPQSLRTLWVALPIGYRYFDYLPCAENDTPVRI